MNADFDSSAYVTHRRHLTRTVHRFVQRTLAGMARLQRRQFAAPWQPAPRLHYDNCPSSPRT
ncbi:hypothetical protein [uncultured Sphingomonas sp.]|uniref:hypothetical protein n=1 Tax=uncultured Sphingomonas sp. TaxID=158754 RepID=UPI0030FB0788